MGRVVIKPGTSFEEARRQLNSIGITLTTHRHPQGGYVCYTSRAQRKQLITLLKI